jgi:hypothetical protein
MIIERSYDAISDCLSSEAQSDRGQAPSYKQLNRHQAENGERLSARSEPRLLQPRTSILAEYHFPIRCESHGLMYRDHAIVGVRSPTPAATHTHSGFTHNIERLPTIPTDKRLGDESFPYKYPARHWRDVVIIDVDTS